VQRLWPKLWRQKNWMLHHDNALSHTSFFTREFFTKNNMTIISKPPHFFLFPWLGIELKGYHFATIELIEAESQAVLNTLTQHDTTHGRGLLRGWWWPVGRKLVFD
jgi:hypothetical protein